MSRATSCGDLNESFISLPNNDECELKSCPHSQSWPLAPIEYLEQGKTWPRKKNPQGRGLKRT